MGDLKFTGLRANLQSVYNELKMDPTPEHDQRLMELIKEVKKELAQQPRKDCPLEESSTWKLILTDLQTNLHTFPESTQEIVRQEFSLEETLSVFLEQAKKSVQRATKQLLKELPFYEKEIPKHIRKLLENPVRADFFNLTTQKFLADVHREYNPENLLRFDSKSTQTNKIESFYITEGAINHSSPLYKYSNCVRESKNHRCLQSDFCEFGTPKTLILGIQQKTHETITKGVSTKTTPNYSRRKPLTENLSHFFACMGYCNLFGMKDLENAFENQIKAEIKARELNPIADATDTLYKLWGFALMFEKHELADIFQDLLVKDYWFCWNKRKSHPELAENAIIHAKQIAVEKRSLDVFEFLKEVKFYQPEESTKVTEPLSKENPTLSDLNSQNLNKLVGTIVEISELPEPSSDPLLELAKSTA